MTNNQKSTSGQVLSAILIPATIIAVMVLAAKVGSGDFDSPDLQMGDCVLRYENSQKDAETWEKKTPKYVVKVEEIGKKNYRVTNYYVSSLFKKTIQDFPGTDRFNYLDKQEKIDCNAGFSEIWNADERR